MFFFATMCYLLNACSEEAVQPIFLTAESPNINIEEDQGTDLQEIDEYYVFHRTSLLGGFSYGKEVPILAEGQEEILIYPGIRKNGLIDQPAIYFIMEEDTLSRNFVPGEEISFQPTFRYRDNVNFRVMDDFENGTVFMEDLDGNTNTTLVRTPGVGYDNSTGAVLNVTADDPLLEVVSLPKLSNFSPAGDIMIEITYKTNVELGVGVYGSEPSFGGDRFYKVILFPTQEWNKVYVDVSAEIRTTGYDEFQLLLGIAHDNMTTTGEAIIDDIKLLYLE